MDTPQTRVWNRWKRLSTNEHAKLEPWLESKITERLGAFTEAQLTAAIDAAFYRAHPAERKQLSLWKHILGTYQQIESWITTGEAHTRARSAAIKASWQKVAASTSTPRRKTEAEQPWTPLNVPYEANATVKTMGARWNAQAKKWEAQIDNPTRARMFAPYLPNTLKQPHAPKRETQEEVFRRKAAENEIDREQDRIGRRYGAEELEKRLREIMREPA